MFAEVRREEGRRKIMLNEKTTTIHEVSAMVSRTFPTARQPKKEEIVCEHCKNPDTLQKLVGTCMENQLTGSQSTKGIGGSRAYQYGTGNQDNAEKLRYSLFQ